MRLRVTKRFSDADRKRTGLSPGVVLDVYASHDNGVWVKCPPVPTKTERGFEEKSAGYTILAPDEYEEL